MQKEIKVLKGELEGTIEKLDKQKGIALNASNRLKINNTVKELRQAAYADHVSEINEDRALLKNRLDRIEPIIKLVLKATTDGQLQKAYKLAKKLKL